MFTTESTYTPSLSVPLRAALIQPPACPPSRLRRRRPELDRRRREALSREFATRVTEHSRWLPADELALLNWVYRSDRPLTELAATGVAPRWVLHRRLNRIVARVLSPAYRHVARRLAITPNPPVWPPLGPSPEHIHAHDRFQLAVARAIFINGRPVREVAQILNISRHLVTRIRASVLVQTEAIGSSPDG